MILPVPSHSNYSTLLADIARGQIKIPQFQRDFVWSVQKSAALLDSIIKGYPIGTFIFWNTKERLRTVRNLGGADLPDAKDGETISFVLDGQQRLTSLYAALRGETITRDDGAQDDYSQLFVNLVANSDEQIVLSDVSALSPDTYITVRDLLNGELTLLVAYDKAYHEKLSEYRKRISSYDFPVVEVRDVPIDVATEIFTRINVGGKPLSVFEIMVAKTYDDALPFDLSEAFEQLIDRLTGVDYDTISDATVLQLVSLVLSGECDKRTILKLPKSAFIEAWPVVADAVERAVEHLRNVYRIPVSKLLPYSTLVVPFAYFFYHHKDKPTPRQHELLQDFFWRCSLGGRYSSSLESKLAQDIKRIDSILGDIAPTYDWPVDISTQFLYDNGRFNASRSFVKAILCLLAFQIPRSFSDDSIVNIKNNWLKQANSKNYHHFFPRSYLEKKGWDEFWINHVLNITIVDDFLNKRSIGAKPPSRYMKDFASSNKKIGSTMATHLIGDFGEFGINNDDYDTFMEKRAEWVSRELAERIVRREIDDLGQVARDDDFEEEAVAGE